MNLQIWKVLPMPLLGVLWTHFEIKWSLMFSYLSRTKTLIVGWSFSCNFYGFLSLILIPFTFSIPREIWGPSGRMLPQWTLG